MAPPRWHGRTNKAPAGDRYKNKRDRRRNKKNTSPLTYLSWSPAAASGLPAVAVCDVEAAAVEPAAICGNCCLKLARRSSPGFCELVLWMSMVSSACGLASTAYESRARPTRPKSLRTGWRAPGASSRASTSRRTRTLRTSASRQPVGLVGVTETREAHGEGRDVACFPSSA